MNNKEFIAEMARRMEMTTKDTSALVQGLCAEIEACLEEEDSVSMPNFGTFEVKKKLERVVVSPSTKQRMLVPPKMVIGFKASANVKEQLKKKR